MDLKGAPMTVIVVALRQRQCGRVGKQSCHLTAESSKSISEYKTSYFAPSILQAILSIVNLTVTLS